jgi:hypothetical protein
MLTSRKFFGLEMVEAQRLRCLVEEHHRLKRLVAELALDNHVPKEVLKENA